MKRKDNNDGVFFGDDLVIDMVWCYGTAGGVHGGVKKNGMVLVC